VPEHGESVGAAAPARQAAIGNGDPQIVMRILGDRLDEVARQAVGGFAPVTVAKEPMAIVADQAVLGAEPDEPLTVLQRDLDRALGEPVGARQVLEHGGEPSGALAARAGPNAASHTRRHHRIQG
jgi:hypothetical protein